MPARRDFDLSKAFKRQKETWDIDTLVSDSLDTIAEVIGTVMELTTAAAQGSYHTKHLNQITWATIQAKYDAAKQNGYSPYSTPRSDMRPPKQRCQ